MTPQQNISADQAKEIKERLQHAGEQMLGIRLIVEHINVDESEVITAIVAMSEKAGALIDECFGVLGDHPQIVGGWKDWRSGGR